MRQFKWGRLIPGLGTAAVLVAFLAFMPEARAESCYEEAVADVEIFTPDFEAPLSGESRLCIADNGIKGDMRVDGVTPGYAYTVWWIYIDQPGGCQGFLGCLFTFFGDDPLLVFGRMDSGIGPKNGKMKFSNRLNDMVVSSGSQVWMLMFGHQAADLNDRRQLARQLLTPEDPGAGFPHLGVAARGYPAAVAIYELP